MTLDSLCILSVLCACGGESQCAAYSIIHTDLPPNLLLVGEGLLR
jgi:hypothetical protein